MTPDERALALLGLLVDEDEAAQGARISHGEISRKFADRAAHCHEALQHLWEEAGDPREVADALLAIAGKLLDRLAAVDPAHRPPHDWLAQVADGEALDGDPAGSPGPPR